MSALADNTITANEVLAILGIAVLVGLINAILYVKAFPIATVVENPECVDEVTAVSTMLSGETTLQQPRHTTLDLYDGTTELRYAYSLPSIAHDGLADQLRDAAGSPENLDEQQDVTISHAHLDELLDVPEHTIYFDNV
jgi:hypothetical protein